MVDFVPDKDGEWRGDNEDWYIRRSLPYLRIPRRNRRGIKKEELASQIEPLHPGFGPLPRRSSGAVSFDMRYKPFQVFWLAFAGVLGGRFAWGLVELMRPTIMWFFDSSNYY